MIKLALIQCVKRGLTISTSIYLIGSATKRELDFREIVFLIFYRCRCNDGWTGNFCEIGEETHCEDSIDNDGSK